ncbi:MULTISPECIES: adenosylcobinamide amidohydrolase [unclassified Methanoculleus]|jgi:adenosylcobinamide hydrolase|uniref:Adenosylcobinamide amidohydrolase n=1 Tax=Methanoculleus palmolei TaxID=72612 RepID=A0ABD8A9V4_9EURY|nr:adenosylcobinamide amidohydrolase [Methanoculleus sp. UBA377]MDD2473949.1 adenosylcobinamide amidohydrolase [Methanoculleus sp.]WOX56314.1 adenosylcobinamide amidohydrolase [Methanoculleus palmolei]
MRYFVRDGTLFLRGRLRAASTGVNGGIADVTTMLSHTVPHDFEGDPVRHLYLVAARHGLFREFFGLMTAVSMRHLCVLQYDFITVFITAGITNPTAASAAPHTINIIVHSREGMSDAALLEAIITATGAKAQALHDLGYDVDATTDAVAVACERDAVPSGQRSVHTSAGTLTEVGRRVHAAVLHGVPEALARWQGEVRRSEPSFFIYSRYGGEHWVEWRKEGCPYYPCHFPGQRCDYCYCPCYPCADEELGEWVESSSGGKIWACTGCTLLHVPGIADYIKRNPEATLAELKRLRDRL